MVDERSSGPARGRLSNDSLAPEREAPSPGQRSTRPFWLVLVLAAVGLLAAATAVVVLRPSAGAPAVESSGEAAIGGPFHLVDQDGRPVDQRVLLGKWSAVFFGYTNCPDTCPATLMALNAAGAQLGAARKDFQVVFISVDPARDTPAQMKLYVDNQGYPPSGLVGLTGTAAQVKAVADAYHAYYAKSGDGPSYAVQHSAAIYLMNPEGKFVKPLEETSPPPELAAQIKQAMHG